jgi:hypothetical protein
MIELANTKTTKAAQVRAYVAKNPKAKPAEIAKAVDTGLQYVYTVMWNAKKKAKAKKTTLTLPKVAKAMEIHKKVMDKTISNWKTMSISSSNTPVQGVTYNVPVQIEMFEPKADPVNHPAHYKVGGIETIDFIEAKKLNYNIGNVVKYLTRADHKGNRKQDLEKAMWYLNREISALK